MDLGILSQRPNMLLIQNAQPRIWHIEIIPLTATLSLISYSCDSITDAIYLQFLKEEMKVQKHS
jgi:hypothetical protein